MDDDNQLNPFVKPQKKVTPTKPHNFVEAVKDVAQEAKNQTKAATTGVFENAFSQLTGVGQSQPPEQFPQAQAPLNYAEYLKNRENFVRQQEQLRIGHQKSAETLVFHQKIAEEKKEIEIIKEKLKEIVKELGGISSELWEVEKTVMTTTTTAGTYYRSFFSRIKSLIDLAKKNICESKTWLQTFNSRMKGRSHYWTQVGISGTKYMQSHERAIATSAG